MRLKKEQTTTDSLPSSSNIERATWFFLSTAGNLSYYLYVDLPIFLRTCTVTVVRKRKEKHNKEKKKKTWFAY